MVRVRFAPSPTGHLHIGGLRAALFNWLFARHNQGKFLLRIEDTDLERSKQEYTDSILESFAWLGITSDEPVAIQSESIPYHQRVLQQLLDEGKAYKCYCTTEEVEKRLSGQEFRKYDQFCRKNQPQVTDGRPYVVRFKVPDTLTEVRFNDLIRGSIVFTSDQLDDFVIARSDGSPVYNFVVVLDDIAMHISHVIRGEEHIGNTPKQIMLYQALGVQIPQFAHLPLILSPSGGKLSKRDGATSVIEYKQQGFLPDALLNYLVHLGWGHGDQEIFTREQLIELFSLEHVGKSGSVFDVKKLEWMNGVYMRQQSGSQLCAYIEREMKIPLSQQLQPWSVENSAHALDVYKERAVTLRELINEVRLLHDGVQVYEKNDETLPWMTPQTYELLMRCCAELEGLTSWTVVDIKTLLSGFCKKAAIKMPAIAQPIRISFIGKTTSPGVAELLALLGREESLKRIVAFVRAGE